MRDAGWRTFQRSLKSQGFALATAKLGTSREPDLTEVSKWDEAAIHRSSLPIIPEAGLAKVPIESKFDLPSRERARSPFFLAGENCLPHAGKGAAASGYSNLTA
ncbi:MAG: hypothetical protein JWL84_11 [Rhodospirillales bacterium]|nr:hypothetical protein [Rhodospirillales bacterium]